MIWGRLGLGKRKTEAGHSVLPAARRVSAPGCWAIGGAGGWDTDTLGRGTVCVSQCVCVGGAEKLIGPPIATVTAVGLQVRWGGASNRRDGVSEALLVLTLRYQTWTFACLSQEADGSGCFCPGPGPTPHGRARGSLPVRFKNSEGCARFHIYASAVPEGSETAKVGESELRSHS